MINSMANATATFYAETDTGTTTTDAYGSTVDETEWQAAQSDVRVRYMPQMYASSGFRTGEQTESAGVADVLLAPLAVRDVVVEGAPVDVVHGDGVTKQWRIDAVGVYTSDGGHGYVECTLADHDDG